MSTAKSLPAAPFSIEPLRELLTSLQKAHALLERTPPHYFRKFGFDPAQPRDEDGQWTKSGAGDTERPVEDAAYQGDFHDAVKKHWLDYFNSIGRNCVDEVRLSLGSVTARIDILCATAIRGQLVGFEVKTGNDPTLTPQQMIVYPHAMGGAGVRSPDAKIGALGLLANVELPPIPILFIYAEKPGSDYHFSVPSGLEPIGKRLRSFAPHVLS